MKNIYLFQKYKLLLPLFTLLFIFFFCPIKVHAQFGGIIEQMRALQKMQQRPTNNNNTRNNNNNTNNSQPAGPTAAEIAAQKAKEEQERLDAESRDFNKQGLAAFDRGDYESAIHYFENALSDMPDYAVYAENIQSAKNCLAAKKKKEEYDKFQRDKNGILTRLPNDPSAKMGFSDSKSEDSKIGLHDAKDGDSELGLPDSKGDNAALGLPDYVNNKPAANLKNTDYNGLNPQLAKYMREADNIKVPDFTWDDILEMKVDGLRKGQDKTEYYWLNSNVVIDVFDLSGAISPGQRIAGKVALFLFVKPSSKAVNEAEILIFKQNAVCEKALNLLKDPVKGPELTSIIKSLRENKPLAEDASPEMIRFANAILDPALGNSSVKIMWSKMLSKQAGSAYVNEAIKGLAEITNEIGREKATHWAQNRFEALHIINEDIIYQKSLLGEGKLNTSIGDTWLEIQEKKMGPFNRIPNAVYNALNNFQDYMGIKQEEPK
jgi:hypothetical protein